MYGTTDLRRAWLLHLKVSTQPRRRVNASAAPSLGLSGLHSARSTRSPTCEKTSSRTLLYSTCLFCHTPLDLNHHLVAFPPAAFRLRSFLGLWFSVVSLLIKLAPSNARLELLAIVNRVRFLGLPHPSLELGGIADLTTFWFIALGPSHAPTAALVRLIDWKSFPSRFAAAQARAVPGLFPRAFLASLILASKLGCIRPHSTGFIGLGRMGSEMAYNLFSKTFANKPESRFVICDAIPEAATAFQNNFTAAFPGAHVDIAATPDEQVIVSLSAFPRM
ncbi:NAD dependent epimerase dehydratase family protein [Mycena chlorophos]|uniref:NAD dependent epimerase dehydratase family protein n=1 Tax=Mycena chlorophos TaxID=658473 RepID=A0A8H6WM74_MYCCL|nr:NAD dependent epimerase dehydratase family protein [Mycena chlorophos]